MPWNFNYRHPRTKNRINMALGPYPDLSLAQARKKAIKARELLAQSVDPHRDELRQAKLAETEHNMVLTPPARFPSLKTTPLADITAPMLIKLLRPIEAKGSLETVERLSQRLNEIMAYGVKSGLIFANPLSGPAPADRAR